MPLASEYKKTYEKTPFFSDKTVPELVNKFNSSIKLIVMIRDPVTRTISGFTHAMSKIKKKINPNRYSSSSRLFEEYVFDVNDTVVNFNLIRR
jgi:[heparan sulfate]-glucosamine 3-sulfotransferase 5